MGGITAFTQPYLLRDEEIDSRTGHAVVQQLAEKQGR